MVPDATALTRSHMQEKLQWATRSATEIVIKEPVDEQAIKHAFWGYLQAYQQLPFYFGKNKSPLTNRILLESEMALVIPASSKKENNVNIEVLRMRM